MTSTRDFIASCNLFVLLAVSTLKLTFQCGGLKKASSAERWELGWATSSLGLSLWDLRCGGFILFSTGRICTTTKKNAIVRTVSNNVSSFL